MRKKIRFCFVLAFILVSVICNGLILSAEENVKFSSDATVMDSDNYKEVELYVNHDIKNTIEEFIPKNLSFMFSSNEFDLVAENSVVFREYLKLRNDYRTQVLNSIGDNEDDLEFVKYEDFKYNYINFEDENNVEVHFTAKKVTKYKGDPILGESVFEYKVRLVNSVDGWKIWCAAVDDNITNPFDNINKIDIIKMCGYPSSSKNKANIEIAKDRLKKLYNNEIDLFFNEKYRIQNGSKINSDIKQIVNCEKEPLRFILELLIEMECMIISL